MTPNVLTPAEISILVDALALREKTLVLLAVTTGLRQGEPFALKWGDVDFAQGTMNVTRSIAYGVVGRCKTESSQKPVPLHDVVADVVARWKQNRSYHAPDDWGLCQRALPKSEALLGPSDFASVHTTQSTRTWHRKAVWLTHVSAYLFHAAP